MPRPTAAQLAYGSCTVILSTLAMLLLSQTSSAVGIAVVAVTALALGLLVALTAPMKKTPRRIPSTTVAQHAPPAPQQVPVQVSVSVSAGMREPVRERTRS
ncbi:hypothetical protein ACIQAC_24110 [Streptomyces sp. NPDC088387]|uniref:hypothetical protein n=1 Tax=Streptomyces sp. NPDC088387 TaxID=3365859 RepID=UPI003814CD85